MYFKGSRTEDGALHLLDSLCSLRSVFFIPPSIFLFLDPIPVSSSLPLSWLPVVFLLAPLSLCSSYSRPLVIFSLPLQLLCSSSNLASQFSCSLLLLCSILLLSSSVMLDAIRSHCLFLLHCLCMSNDPSALQMNLKYVHLLVFDVGLLISASLFYE